MVFIPHDRKVGLITWLRSLGKDQASVRLEWHKRGQLTLSHRDPDREITVIDGGLPSETVSGLSEAGHAGGKFPRPDLHERLDRVLAVVKPDLVFATSPPTRNSVNSSTSAAPSSPTRISPPQATNAPE